MTSLSLSQAKHIRALHTKKYRDKHKAFLVEGRKCIEEFIKEGWACLHYVVQETTQPINGLRDVLRIADKKTFKSISALSNASDQLAVFQCKDLMTKEDFPIWVALDHLQDPGNLGTIIRTMDWFGCQSLILSEGCVDVFNPKVIQASMGSVSRVAVQQVDRKEWQKIFGMRHILFADLEGISFSSKKLAREIYPGNHLSPLVLVIGNEGNGIHPSTRTMLSHTSITIPRGGHQLSNAESLNAAMATGIMLSYFSSKLAEGNAANH